MNLEKLKKLEAQVRIGGKGTPRRKRKVVHSTVKQEDKKLQTLLKKCTAKPLQGTEAAYMFMEDGCVMHFRMAKIHGSVPSNMLVIVGTPNVKQLREMMPGIFPELGSKAQSYIQKLTLEGKLSVPCQNVDTAVMVKSAEQPTKDEKLMASIKEIDTAGLMEMAERTVAMLNNAKEKFCKQMTKHAVLAIATVSEVESGAVATTGAGAVSRDDGSSLTLVELADNLDVSDMEIEEDAPETESEDECSDTKESVYDSLDSSQYFEALSADDAEQQLDGEQTDVEQSDFDQSDFDQSDGHQSGGDQSDGDQSDGDQSDGDQSGGDQSGGDQSGGDQSDGDQSYDEQSYDDQSYDDQSYDDQSDGDQSDDEQSDNEQSKGEQQQQQYVDSDDDDAEPSFVVRGGPVPDSMNSIDDMEHNDEYYPRHIVENYSKMIEVDATRDDTRAMPFIEIVDIDEETIEEPDELAVYETFLDFHNDDEPVSDENIEFTIDGMMELFVDSAEELPELDNDPDDADGPLDYDSIDMFHNFDEGAEEQH